MRAWGRLLRLSLWPSAAADVAAGVAVGAGGRWPAGPAPWLLIAASLAVYGGNMALNDWADREADRRTRPERPIPSGAVPAPAALGAAIGLQLAGLVLAIATDPRSGGLLAAVAVLASSYNLAGRGPVLGPLLLGLCRAGNLSLGLVLTGAAPLPAALAPALYGTYVFFVSRLGRLEDDEDTRALGPRPRRALWAAAVALAAVPCLPLGTGLGWRRLASLLLAGWAAAGLARRASAGMDRAAVGAATGAALRRLLVFTAAATLLAGPGADALPALCAGAILAGYPVSFWLRGLFPPT